MNDTLRRASRKRQWKYGLPPCVTPALRSDSSAKKSPPSPGWRALRRTTLGFCCGVSLTCVPVVVSVGGRTCNPSCPFRRRSSVSASIPLSLSGRQFPPSTGTDVWKRDDSLLSLDAARAGALVYPCRLPRTCRPPVEAGDAEDASMSNAIQPPLAPAPAEPPASPPTPRPG